MNDYKGTEVDNIWDDILPIGQKQAEGLNYPTQKPKALIERIVKASSKQAKRKEKRERLKQRIDRYN